MTDFDVIVIGSGAGGLAAAVAMAKAGQRVAVFEQHYLPGGWCHSFQLDRYKFSPGVHYVGQLQEGGLLRKIYEGLGLGQDLSFYELNPKGFDHIYIGDECTDIPKGKEAFAELLAAKFPQEARGIRGYLETVDSLNKQLSDLTNMKLTDLPFLPWKARSVLRWGWQTGEAMINHFVENPSLRGILAGQSGDHGLPPSQVSAAMHAAITAHYFEGGWYPKGGGTSLPRAHIRALKKHGGELHVRTGVAEIVIERGRATGVRLQNGRSVTAKTIISNADPAMTFGRLVDERHQSSRLKRKLSRTQYSVSALSLFMAAKFDARALGLDSGNYWLYSHNDVDKIYRQGLTPWGPEISEVPGMFLTITTLKDPSKDYDGVHTMEAFAFISHDAFKKWNQTKLSERPEAYLKLKQLYQDKMLKKLEQRIPGLRDKLVFSSLGTPLTKSHFCAAEEGNLYGTSKIRSQVGPLSYQVTTEFENLYLCGASTMSHGILGAAMSGMAAARTALNCRMRDLLDSNGAKITLLDAETERAKRDRDLAQVCA